MMQLILYIANNLAILVLLGIVMSLLGLDSGSTTGLLVFAALLESNRHRCPVFHQAKGHCLFSRHFLLAYPKFVQRMCLQPRYGVGNDVVFGSVNANMGHYSIAAEALERAVVGWIERIITRRVPLERGAGS